jgi:hypothetical protein
MKNYTGIIIITCLIFISPIKAFAQADYVLPYPSFMPGSKLYILQEIKNSALQYWYFGNFGKFTYNLNQADKYLVEAKTLFEYRQYLLADRALKKSDYFFQQTFIYLEKAHKENKNTIQKQKILKEASLKHVEILNKLKNELPENFIWSPEKSSPTRINIKQNIDKSIEIRTKRI